jgi:hypothetical protein
MPPRLLDSVLLGQALGPDQPDFRGPGDAVNRHPARNVAVRNAAGATAVDERANGVLGDGRMQRAVRLLKNAPRKVGAHAVGPLRQDDQRSKVGDARRAELIDAAVEQRDGPPPLRLVAIETPQEGMLAGYDATEKLVWYFVVDQPFAGEQPLVGSAAVDTVIAVRRTLTPVIHAGSADQLG